MSHYTISDATKIADPDDPEFIYIEPVKDFPGYSTRVHASQASLSPCSQPSEAPHPPPPEYM